MANNTEIEFADRTANPVMGCSSGCELSPKPHEIVDSVVQIFSEHLHSIEKQTMRDVAEKLLEGKTSSEIFHVRQQVLDRMFTALNATVSASEKRHVLHVAETELKSRYVCFAHVLHLRFGANPMRPDKLPKNGYAPVFEQPILTPGKVADAVSGPDLFGRIRPFKQWMDCLPTVILVSDTGDSLAPDIAFDYLKTEVIDVAVSPQGKRCILIWFTKQPRQMLKFAEWLQKEHGVSWPENIMPVTSVTSPDTTWRVDYLREMPAPYKGVSAEPLWAKTEFSLERINWVVCGGQSGWYRNRPFDLAWARHLRDQCQAGEASFFMKQLGNAPTENGQPFPVKSAAGGDWNEFPPDLRIREMPRAFYSWGMRRLFAHAGCDLK